MTLLEMFSPASWSWAKRPEPPDSGRSGGMPPSEPENEYDTGTPGEPRPMTALWETLSADQRKVIAAFNDPERHLAKRPLSSAKR